MQLDQRKLKILAAIVDQYIETGEPVSSKYLAALADLSVSSATVRNDMAALSEIGLIEQPHTSAGRIPTPSGWRLYIDRLMNRKPPSPEERKLLDSLFKSPDPDPDRLLEQAGEMLAELTGYAAISAAITHQDATILHIGMIPTGPRSLALVMATSSGAVKTRRCRIDFPLTPEVIEAATRFFSQELVGRRLDEISLPAIQTMAARSGDSALKLFPLLRGVLELAREIGEGEMYLRGQQNLLSHQELSDVARRLFDLLSDRDELLCYLSAFQSGVHVSIGGERDAPFPQSGVVVGRYRIGRLRNGMLAVIGPVRQDYAKAVSHLEYVSARLEELLGGLSDE